MGFHRSEFSKYLNVKSSRHHYIPKFLIKGFTSKDGLLFVYDKKKDKILTDKRSPKSLFFENNRNTLEITSDVKSSILEDSFYQSIDNDSSKVIKYLQNTDSRNIELQITDIASLNFFLISLFWRIPKTDYAAEDLVKKSIIVSEHISSETFRDDPVFKKLSRAGFFNHHIEEIRNFGAKGHKWHNTHQTSSVQYVIGDYPFLHRTQPNEFREFDNIDLLFAVSSNKIYSSTNKILNKFTSVNSYYYNASIINQSINYIACADFNVLNQSISFYKKLTQIGLIYSNEGAFLDL